jgi:hypothetical protein
MLPRNGIDAKIEVNEDKKSIRNVFRDSIILIYSQFSAFYAFLTPPVGLLHIHRIILSVIRVLGFSGSICIMQLSRTCSLTPYMSHNSTLTKMHPHRVAKRNDNQRRYQTTKIKTPARRPMRSSA